MTRGEVISQVRNGLKMVNADYKMPNKYIWSIIMKHLRWMIKRESEKLKILSYDNLFLTLKGAEIEEAPAIDECCGVRSKCTVFRTKYKVPAIFESGSGVIIKSMFTLDGSLEYNKITVQEYLRKLENPNSQYDKSRYYYYNSGYIYFPNNKLKKVMVKAYFEDEDEVDEFNEANGCGETFPCRSKLELEARIPDGIVGELMKFVIADIAPSRQIRNDDQIDKNENNIR